MLTVSGKLRVQASGIFGFLTKQPIIRQISIQSLQKSKNDLLFILLFLSKMMINVQFQFGAYNYTLLINQIQKQDMFNIQPQPINSQILHPQKQYNMNNQLTIEYMQSQKVKSLSQFNSLRSTYTLKKFPKIYFSNIEEMKQKVSTELSKYIQSLLSQFVSYSYLLLKKSDAEEKLKPQICIKEFFCINICVNLFNFKYTFTKFCKQHFQDDLKQLQKWLSLIIQKYLLQQLNILTKSFPQSTQNLSRRKEQSWEMKGSIKKIDRRQNQEYDFLMLHQITFQKSAKVCLLQIINKIMSQNKEIESQIRTMLHAILKDSSNLEDKSLQNIIKQMNSQSLDFGNIRKIQKQSTEFSCFQQIEMKIFTSNGQNQYDQVKNINIRQRSQLLRILTKFIQNILNFIQDPKQSTLERSYPYKNLNNMLIFPSPQINKKLYDKIKDARQRLYQKNNILKKIKQDLLETQISIIQDVYSMNQFQPIDIVHKISQEMSKEMFKKCVLYSQKLIQMVIEAGKIEIDDVKLNINLITFNVIDLFRGRQSVSFARCQQILEKIYKLQQPRGNNQLSARQNIFRILRIKDKTQSASKAVYVSFLYKKQICEAQINTKSNGDKSLYDISHLLYQLMRGQFGIICEMLTIIASKFQKASHHVDIFLQSKSQKDKEIIDSAKQSINSNLQKKSKIIELSNNRKNWTDVFYAQNFQDQLQNSERLEYIIHPKDIQTFKNMKLQDKNFVKYIVLNGENFRNENEFVLQQIDGFLCLQRLVLNNFKDSNCSNLMKNISFINHFALFSLKQLNLSNNNLSNFQPFRHKNRFKSLLFLNLSSNKFEKQIDYDAGCFIKLKILDLSNNNINKIKIFKTSFTRQKAEDPIIIQKKMIQNIRQTVNDAMLEIESNNSGLVIEIHDMFQILSLKIILNMDRQLNRDQNSEEISTQFDQADKKDQLSRSKKKQSANINKIYKLKNFKDKLPIFQATNKINQSSLGFAFPTSKYINDFQEQLKKMTGVIKIVEEQNDKTPQLKQLFTCLQVGRSLILIAPAQAIIKTAQKKEWYDPKTHETTKAKILKRMRYYSYQQLQKQQAANQKFLQCQQLWFPIQYIKGNMKYDICVLFLKKGQLAQNLSTQNLFKILFRENRLITYNLLLSGYILGFNTQKAHCKQLLCSFAHIMYNNCQQNIEFHSINNIYVELQGSPIIYVKRITPQDYNFYILGIKQSFLFDQTTKAVLFNQDLLTLYKHMIFSFTEKDFDVKSFFMKKQEFKKIQLNTKSSQSILQNQDNILPFIGKLLKCIISFLEKYLFLSIDDCPQNIRDQLLQMIYIYNNMIINEDQYQVDIRNINLQTIFEQKIMSPLQDKANHPYLPGLSQLQTATAKVIIIILSKIQAYAKQKQTAQVITQISTFIITNTQLSNKQQPIALKNILHVIQSSINQYNIAQITKYLKKPQTLSMLIDKDYFSAQYILTHFNIIQRIQCFAEHIVRAHYYRRNKALVLIQNQSYQKQDFKNIKIFQECSYFYKQAITKMNIVYMSALETFLRSQQSFLNQQNISQAMEPQFSQTINKIYILQTLKQYYPKVAIINRLLKVKGQYVSIFSLDSVQLTNLVVSKISETFNQTVKQKIREKIIMNDMSLKGIEVPLQSTLNQEFIQMLKLYEYSFLCRPRQIKFNCQQQVPQEFNFGRNPAAQKKNVLFKQLPVPRQVYSTTIIDNPIEKVSQSEQNFYQNYIGAILVLDDPQMPIIGSFEKQFCGTGVVIGKNTVLSVAHNLSPFIQQEFQKGRFRFVLSKYCKRTKKFINKFYVIIEVQLFQHLDKAILILEDQIVDNCKIRLLTHNDSSQCSSIVGRRYFCQLIGFIKRDSYRLYKSEGFVFIQDIYQQQFKYSLSSAKGQSGGLIIFYPTGKLEEPFILGIHSQGYHGHEDFVGQNNQIYFKKKYNYGQIILSDELQLKKKIKFSVKGSKLSKQSLNISTASQNSYIFSDSMQQINKWRLTHNFALHVYKQQKQFGQIYSQAYFTIAQYVSNGLVFTKIAPENLFCFNNKSKLPPFFDVQVEYLNPKQIQVNGKIVKDAYQLAINQYKRHLESVKIVQPFRDYLQKMKKSNQKQFELEYDNFKKTFKNEIKLLKGLFSNEDCHKTYRQFQNKIKTILEIEQRLRAFDIFQPSQLLIELITIIKEINAGDLIRKNELKRLQQAISYIQQYKAEQNLSKQEIKFEEIEEKYFNQQLLFLIFLKNHQVSEDKIKLMELRYIQIKTACECVYQLYRFSYQHKLQKNSQKKYLMQTGFYILPKCYRFFQSQLVSEKLVKMVIITRLSLRAEAILLIQKLGGLSEGKRTKLLKQVLNWKMILQQWKSYKLHQRYPIDLLYQHQQIAQIISILREQYRYFQQGQSHYFNLGIIVLEQLVFHRTLFRDCHIRKYLYETLS